MLLSIVYSIRAFGEFCLVGKLLLTLRKKGQRMEGERWKHKKRQKEWVRLRKREQMKGPNNRSIPRRGYIIGDV